MNKKVIIGIIVGIVIFFIISSIVIFSILGLFIIGVASSSNTNTNSNIITTNTNVIPTSSRVTGTITVSSKEEKEYAKMVIDTLFNALEDKDAQSIKNLFSQYAKNNTYNLDGKINELMNFYPGANGGYESSGITKASKGSGTQTHALELKMTIKNQNSEYEMKINMYIRNDSDSSKIGVNSIEVAIEGKKPAGFKWKTIDSAPGIYLTI